MSSEHDCLTEGCKGSKYDGANVICERCLRPCYIECYAKRKEISELMKFGRATNIPGTPTIVRIHEKIAAIFGQDSCFGFTCLKCKSNGSFKEVISATKKKLQAEYESNLSQHERDLNDNLNSVQIALQASNNQVNTLNDQALNLMIENSRMQQSLASLTKERQDHVCNVNENDIEMNVSTNSVIVEQINHSIKTLMQNVKDELATVTNDIEARVKLECDKIAKHLMKCGESPKRKKPNENVIKPNDPNIVEKNNIVMLNLCDDDLKPPPPNEKVDSREVYEIHISKFRKDTKEANIVTHIMIKISINNELFKVTKLDTNERNYTSFKITTLHDDIYEQLMNNELWAPDFKARNYEHPKENRMNKKPLKNRWQQKNDDNFITGRNEKWQNDLRKTTMERNFMRNLPNRNVNNTTINRNENRFTNRSSPQQTYTPKRNIESNERQNTVNGVNRSIFRTPRRYYGTQQTQQYIPRFQNRFERR